MSDETTPVPALDHNLPPIANLAHEMTHHAVLWANDLVQGEKHRDAVMTGAFRLRSHMEDPDLRLLVKGLLADAKVPTTARSQEFTQLLNLAFHKAEVKPEKSQISRWAGALQHAWSCDPRPTPEEVAGFIKNEGGDVACAKKAREAGRAGAAFTAAPQPFQLPCDLPANLVAQARTIKGKKVIPGQWEDDGSGWQFVLRQGKVVSSETTTEPATA